MLKLGVVVLGVTDRPRAEEFWCAALGYRVRDDGFGGWARVLEPPGGTGTMIALQLSETALDDYPRHHLDLHVADAAEREAEADRLVSLGASRVDWDRYPDDPDFIVLADTEGQELYMAVQEAVERERPDAILVTRHDEDSHSTLSGIYGRLKEDLPVPVDAIYVARDVAR